MNKATFNRLINTLQFSEDDLSQLEQLSTQFPFCQLGHILIAKAYHDQHHMLSDNKLKNAAVYSASRKQLRTVILHPELVITELNDNPVITIKEDISTIDSDKKPLPETNETTDKEVKAEPVEKNINEKEVNEKVIEEEIPITEIIEEKTITEDQQEESSLPDPISNQDLTTKDDIEVTSIKESVNDGDVIEKIIEEKTTPPETIENEELISDEQQQEAQVTDSFEQHHEHVEEIQEDIKEQLEKLKSFKNKIRLTELKEPTQKEEPKPVEPKIHINTSTKKEEKKEEPIRLVITKEEKPIKKKKADKKKPAKKKEQEETTPLKNSTENTAIEEKEVATPPTIESQLGDVLQHKNENTDEVDDNSIDFIYSYLDLLRDKRTKDSKNTVDQSGIIDSFIETSPSISKLTKNKISEEIEDLAMRSVTPPVNIVTENLALINARQGNIQKAITIYEQLILKSPQKKTYFAAQIEKLKKQ